MANPSQKTLQKETRSGSDKDIHARIGTRLKAYYDDILAQPVPDRFENLLRQLDEQCASPREQEKR
ncbi:NepR family anti-sigma factor [Stappia sp.]|uniref:NepR family anti-sigma factor n=1 Tax=Stappia sp. TaxID=1870903 RepID=UPI003A99BE68